MDIGPCITHDDVVFEHVEDMPVSLIQELEIYFRIDEGGIARCLEEGMTVREIKALCRDIHNRSLH